MSVTLGDALVYFRGDQTQLKADLGAAEQATKSWTGRLGQMADSVGGFFKRNQAEIVTAGRAALGFAADITRMGAESKQAVFGIQATFKDTAASWIDWSEKIMYTMGTSDEAILNSARDMLTLKNNFGFTEDQMRTLITTGGDLGAVMDIDLATAANDLTMAMQGNARGARELGLALDDDYLKNVAFGGSLKDVWDKLSESEKAQYRYKAALEQAAFAQGKAAEKAQTATGQYNNLKTAIEEQLEALGREINKSGPWVRMLTDGVGLVDQLNPLLTLMTLRKIADTGATVTHTTAQVADNAAMVAGTTATTGLTGALGAGTSGLVGAFGAVTAAVAPYVAAFLAAIAAGWGVEQVTRQISAANWQAGDDTKIYEGQLKRLKIALDSGQISAAEYNRLVAESSLVIDDTATRQEKYTAAIKEAGTANTDLATIVATGTRGIVDSSLAALSAKGNFNDWSTAVYGLDVMTAGATTKVAGLGLQLENLPKNIAISLVIDMPPSIPGTAGETAANQKAAAERLKRLAADRATELAKWDDIIAENARRSDDKRVQSALAALDAEDRGYTAAVAKRKSDEEGMAAFYKTKQAEIDTMRTQGHFKEAGDEEQKLNLIKEWHRQHDVSLETLETEHLARRKLLYDGYSTAINASEDQNLATALLRKEQEKIAWDEYEAKVRGIMATGKIDVQGFASYWKDESDKAFTGAKGHVDDYAKKIADKFDEKGPETVRKPLSEWRKSWGETSSGAWTDGKKDIDAWDEHLDQLLFKGRDFHIKGVYHPPTGAWWDPTAEARDAGGPATPAPTTTPTGGGRRGGPSEFQHGGVVHTPGNQPWMWARVHDEEIITNPRNPWRGLAALAQAGLLASAQQPAAPQQPIFQIQAQYAYQSEQTLTDFIRTQQLLYGE
jgi:hypothetical protein